MKSEAALAELNRARLGDDSQKRALKFLLVLTIALVSFGIFTQALIVADVRPLELITSPHGPADFIRRASPPDFSRFSDMLYPTLETVDIALVGTVAGIVMALPLAVLGARNVTPYPALYYLSRGVIGYCRSVPDLVWALLFVTAVGLGPFPGVCGIAMHSIGMLGRLFSEVIEDMDMGPVEALTLTGASRLQVFTQAVVPSVAPSLLGIGLYRFDENLRSSLVLGFVGAGGLGFQLLSAMNLFQYRTVSLLLLITFVLVMCAERLSAALRRRVL
jgi:phosphonate transport system permease protein